MARQALTTGGGTPEPGIARHGFQPLPRRGAAVTNTLIDSLLEEQ